MGQRIVKHTIDGKDLYLVWSSIVDAPITYGGSLLQVKNYWKDEYGRSGLESLELALERGHKKIFNVEEVYPSNRAGKDGACLSVEQIVDYYFVRRGRGAKPVGGDNEPEEAEEEEACSICSGPLTLLGTLGKRKHYRCRNCGFDSSGGQRLGGP